MRRDELIHYPPGRPSRYGAAVDVSQAYRRRARAAAGGRRTPEAAASAEHQARIEREAERVQRELAALGPRGGVLNSAAPAGRARRPAARYTAAGRSVARGSPRGFRKKRDIAMAGMLSPFLFLTAVRSVKAYPMTFPNLAWIGLRPA